MFAEKSSRTGLIFALVSFMLPGIQAQTPLGTAFTYQGQLKVGGNPAGGLHDLRFRLFDAAVAGAQVGATLCVDDVNVTDGLFVVLLDFGAHFAGQERFLEVQVRADAGLTCGSTAGFVSLAPRQSLTATPNALFALNADSLDGLNSTAFLQAIPNPLNLAGAQAGSYTIRAANTSSASNSFGLLGEITSTSPGGFSAGLRGLNNGTGGSGIGVWGSQEGSGWGVYATSVSGRGVYGRASATNGTTYGGYFQSLSSGGTGVFADSAGPWGVYGRSTEPSSMSHGGYFQSSSTSGIGVRGSALAATGTTYGGYFESDSGSGYGVFASSAGTHGVAGLSTLGSAVAYGGYFQSNSTGGRGVFGYALAPTGTTYGGRFESDSNSGRGVFGFASAGSGRTYGGYFESNSTTDDGTTTGYGVYATSAGRYGVYGVAEGDSYAFGGHFIGPRCGVYGEAVGSLPYGVWGWESTPFEGYGVYSTGDLGASGTKSFRIDHPFDPENKYLLHYVTESPFPQNFYNGTVVTDANGYAWVELPDYFAEINTNFKYVLTVVDDSDAADFVLAKVSRKIRGNRFQVRTSAPNVEVSWRVDADRNDLRVRDRRPTDVREKQGEERGKYQHPEYYGLPPEMRMKYNPDSAKPNTE